MPPLTRAAKYAWCIAKPFAEQNAIGETASYGCMNVGNPAAAGILFDVICSLSKSFFSGSQLGVDRPKLTLSRSLSPAGTNHDVVAPTRPTNTVLWLSGSGRLGDLAYTFEQYTSEDSPRLRRLL